MALQLHYYPQAGDYKIIDGHVILPKVGELRVFMHRIPVGKVKTMTIKRDRVGDWFIILNCESPEVPPRQIHKVIGIDLGLIKLVQASNGEFEMSKRFYQKSERKLQLAQQRLSRKHPGSKNRIKAIVKLARIHRKIRRQRDYFLHMVSKELVSRGDLLVFEDLEIPNMISNHKLAKSIADASWGKLVQYVSYKALSAGKRVVRVNPRGTTSDCACGKKVKLSLSERTFHCPDCGLTIDRDLHGSFGTLRKVGWEAAELTPVEMRPLLARRPASLVAEAGSSRLRP
jgi:putative transposase